MSNLKKLLSILTACLVLMTCTFLVACKGDEETDDDKSTSKSDKKDTDESSSKDKDDESSSEESETTEEVTEEKTKPVTEKPDEESSSNAGSLPGDFDEDALDPVDYFISSMEEKDPALAFGIFPEAMLDMLKTMMGDPTVTNEELVATLMEDADADFPENVEILCEYEVLGASEFTADEVDAANAWLAETEALLASLTEEQIAATGLNFDISALSATDGYHITMDMGVQASVDGNSSDAIHELTFDVVKIDGTWTFDLFNQSEVSSDFITVFTETFAEDFDGILEDF